MSGKVSVAMATYNGENYIRQQIESILENLRPIDELIISDDGSTDNTKNIINEYILKDNRITFIQSLNKGIKKNFENAINNCTGKYIFLCDQDDIWLKDKVTKVIECFEKEKCSLVIHDAEVFNDYNGEIIYESFFDYRKSGSGVIKNIYKNTYIGCCMAFDSKLKDVILPIPDNIEMHDQWIGVINDLKFKNTIFLNDKLIRYRRHLNNASKMKRYDFYKMLRNRFTFIKEIIKKFKGDKKWKQK